MINTLNKGNRKDIYLFCSKQGNFYLATFTDFKTRQFLTTACKYKRLFNVVKFAKKYRLTLNFYKGV